MKERPNSERTSSDTFTASTIPALFLERCRRTPSHVAQRVKTLGIYREVTYQEYLDRVENICLGLLELGLVKGDRVAIIGDACPEWLYMDLACQSAGGVSFGIHPTSGISDVKHLMVDGGAKFLLAQGQEYADKILSIADDLPQLEKVIVIDFRAMYTYDDPHIVSLAHIEKAGSASKQKQPDRFEKLVGHVQSQDVATLIYTAGTTGTPKGTMFTQAALLCESRNLICTLPQLSDAKARIVSYLPMANALGRELDGYCPLLSGYVVHFGETASEVLQTVFDVAPSIFVGAPRTFEKLAAQVLVGVETSTRLKKSVFHLAMRLGRGYVQRRWEGRSSVLSTLLYKLSYLVAFRPVLDKLGLIHVKLSMVTSAPVPPSVATLWQIWGVDLVEGYGSTEAGFIATQRGPLSRPGNVGPPLPDVEVKLTEYGELLVRQAGCFLGYWQDHKVTAEAVKDGWVHTGDIVEIDQAGNLKVIGRKTDILTTAGGKRIMPSQVEKTLKGSPYIGEAVVFGNDRAYLTALIEIDFDTVSEWARSKGISYTSFGSLATHPDVYRLISGELDRSNAQLAGPEQVKRFRIIPRELDPEDEADPLTPTRKVQRQRAHERFRELVEDMYREGEEPLPAARPKQLAEGLA